MELIPAIDIIGGRCVRLTKGDYTQMTTYGDPIQMAADFERLGFRRLHLVDLDGARSRHVVNIETLRGVTSTTRLTVDFGGGLKSGEEIEAAFQAGAAMVTVGSVAVTRPELFRQWLDKYGAERIILGADVRNGKISINGWTDDSEEELLPFLDRYVHMGVKNVLCTEISRDGTLSGPATSLYKKVMEAHPSLHLIASGGVSAETDISELREAGVPAVVFGKAIYEGRIDLRRLLLSERGRLARTQSEHPQTTKRPTPQTTKPPNDQTNKPSTLNLYEYETDITICSCGRSLQPRTDRHRHYGEFGKRRRAALHG